MFKIPKYQLYLLQLENYEPGRYLKLLFKKGLLLPKDPLRKSLVWTAKAKGLFLMAAGLYVLLPIIIVGFWIPAFSPPKFLSEILGDPGVAGMTIKIILLLTAYCLLFFFFFAFYLLSLIFLWPFDWLVKKIIIARAKTRINQLTSPSPPPSPARGEGGLVVIGIAGSYGKTTMKEVLLEVLGAKFNVAATPESVNTPVGIARWILRNFKTSNYVAPSSVPPNGGPPSPAGGEGNIEVAIIEMGEHYKGDVEYLCKIAPPDTAVVTGINEAHLERMGKMETVVSTIFEIVSGTKPQGLVVLNGDDERAVNHYKEFVWPDHRVSEYKKSKIKDKKFNPEILSWEGEFEGLGKINVELLGEYALADVQAAVIIAKDLGMDVEEIKQGIAKIRPVPHRLQPILSPEEVLVIDDSYNGNPDGAAEAIEVLSRLKDRRKIYITPGLVEMGGKTPGVHREVGRQLAEVADVVILIRNSVTPWIEEGILSVSSSGETEARLGDPSKSKKIDSRWSLSRTLIRGGNDKTHKPEIIWFDTAQEMHARLSTIIKPKDVVLFQNDWGDNYI